MKLSDLSSNDINKMFGQESGNRKDRVRATREMIEPFFDLTVPVFMKNNLAGIVPGRELRKEFP